MKALTLIAMLTLTACTLGPDYQRPTVAVPDVWRQAPVSATDLTWWESFHDATLRDLIAESLERNHDLRIAMTRVEQARAILGITNAERFPHIDATAAAAKSRASNDERNVLSVATRISF